MPIVYELEYDFEPDIYYGNNIADTKNIEYTIEFNRFAVGKIISYGHKFFNNLLEYIAENTDKFSCHDAYEIVIQIHKIIKIHVKKKQHRKKNLTCIIHIGYDILTVYIDFKKKL